MTTLIGIAPPVAREGYVFDHVRLSTKPKFFVQGEADEVCPLEALVKLPIPDVVKCELPSPTQITVRSIDKQVLGQFAANIRAVRPVEPYKGKGIRYVGEYVRRKAGKAFAST